MMRTKFYFTIVTLCNIIGLSDKITHMTMKIAVTPEYQDEKKTLSLKQVTFHFVAKIINCFK